MKKFNKYHNLYCYLIYLVLILISLNVSVVKADEVDSYDIVDFSKKGSISITLSASSDNTKVNGANITIYKLADASEKDHNLTFKYHDDLNTCQSDLENGNITNEVLECVKESKVFSLENLTDVNGNVKFSDLDLGLYLITQTNQVEGYSKIKPFLIMIPEILDNSWNYNIEATPKVDIVRLFDLTVEKVWNVDDNNIPSKITIELLKNGGIIDIVVLNSENNWSYVWKQIEKSDEYSVKEINIPDGYIASYRQEGNKFIVTNTKTLVQTGQRLWINLLLVVIGLFFITTGIVLNKRSNHE